MKLGSLNLLDTAIILLSSATITVFLLWAAGEVLELSIFTTVPEYLKAITNNTIKVITGGTIGSVLLLLIRNQLGGSTPPNYLAWVLISTMAVVLMIFAIAVALPKIRNLSVDGQKPYKLNSIAKEYQAQYEVIPYPRKGLLTIRGKFKPNREVSTVYIEHIQTESFEDSFQITIDSKDAGTFINLERAFIVGVCVSQDNGRLSILYKKWFGAATSDGSLYSLSYNPFAGRFESSEIQSEVVAGGIEENGIVVCDDNASNRFGNVSLYSDSSWSIKEKPCICSFENNTFGAAVIADEFIKKSGLDALPIHVSYSSDFWKGKEVAIPYQERSSEIPDSIIRELTERIYLSSGSSYYTVKNINLATYDLLALSYNPGPREAWHYLLYKAKDTDSWLIAYYAHGNPKSFLESRFCGATSDGTFIAEICVDNCDWWGRTIPVKFNMHAGSMVMTETKLCH